MKIIYAFILIGCCIHESNGILLIKSGLQKIIRIKAITSSFIDNLQIGLVSDKLIDDVVSVHINKLDIFYLGLFTMFIASQFILVEYRNEYKNLNKLSKISSYTNTKKVVNYIFLVIYFICVKGIENAV